MSKQGLIGGNINYSYSKIIHEYLYKKVLNKEITYEIINTLDLEKTIKNNYEELNYYNITIPYKKDIINYLDSIDNISSCIKAVNLIVNSNNLLVGFNTDYYGFSKMIEINNLNLKNKKVLILGSGATSQMVSYYLKNIENNNFQFVSRVKKESYLAYQDFLYSNDFQVIINTTPAGNYPNFDDLLINIDLFKKLETVIDLNYNPRRSKLMDEAYFYNIDNNNIINGLDMLIFQAIKAFEIVNKISVDLKFFYSIKRILDNNQNYVLIGLPYAGKSTIGKLVSEASGYKFYDSDKIIVERYGSIDSLIKTKGLGYFRNFETEVIKELSLNFKSIISTGGGAILDKLNMRYLRSNSIIIYLKRSLKEVNFDETRPLATNIEELEKLASFRASLYEKYADYTIENNNINDAVKQIIKIIKE